MADIIRPARRVAVAGDCVYVVGDGQLGFSVLRMDRAGEQAKKPPKE